MVWYSIRVLSDFRADSEMISQDSANLNLAIDARKSIDASRLAKNDLCEGADTVSIDESFTSGK